VYPAGLRAEAAPWSTSGKILYWFSPSCPWCAKNIQNVKALSSAVGNGYRLVGIALDSPELRAYAENAKITFPIYSINETVRRAWKLQGTPTTIVLGAHGEVQRVWIGAYEHNSQIEIERFFGTKLPGLVPGTAR
jgi:hypothetical protein